MSTTARTTGDGGDTTESLGVTAPNEAHVVTAATSGDRCNVCGAEMSADQRYCVECGHRRGKARFTLGGAGASRETTTTTTTVTRARSGGFSPGATLLAGIATLLLALGVGVLIGHNNNQAAKSPHYTFNVGGGGSSAGSSGSTGLASTGSGSGSSSSSGGTTAGTPKKAVTGKAAAKAIKKAPTAAASAAATKAASSTLKAASGAKSAPQTTKQAGACTAGTAGCSGGKFTGNFFGN